MINGKALQYTPLPNLKLVSLKKSGHFWVKKMQYLIRMLWWSKLGDHRRQQHMINIWIFFFKTIKCVTATRQMFEQSRKIIYIYCYFYNVRYPSYCPLAVMERHVALNIQTVRLKQSFRIISISKVTFWCNVKVELICFQVNTDYVTLRHGWFYGICSKIVYPIHQAAEYLYIMKKSLNSDCKHF